ncbi:protein retinal degeneration B-like isoform X3 [Centruroides vittatus]|uniref:protein retinal degeneration B-like isoform X3 n=1 Tax=Centruroides vittatus TaxID=120091 RepID=UPI003510CF4A
MLVKEYRIPLPLSVKEYQVAQLYMIAKKSREETKGAESGVEIMVNEPYTDGPGGSGQYTRKIYHIGSHLPGWLKTLLPKSVLMVEEEAWNAYPFTKTRYTCPFVEKFFLEIETKYINDGGEIENVFQLPNNELKQRTVDVIDIVRDPLVGSDYRSEEDPTLFVSEKTKRGPLSQNWIEEYSQYKQNIDLPNANDSEKDIMCAYKLCRVEFKYWGMQSKIERFIHDTALRRTMLRAHRQAWAWQDEWVGLTLEDIRRLEKETQEELAKTMSANKCLEQDDNPCQSSGALTREESNSETTSDAENEIDAEMESIKKVSNSSFHLSSQDKTLRASCLDLQMGNLIMETIVQSSDLSSDDEYFDAEDDDDDDDDDDDGAQILARSCSEAILECTEKDNEGLLNESQDDSIFSAVHIKKVQKELFFQERNSRVNLDSVSLTSSPSHRLNSSTNTLILVLHAGSILDSGAESITNKKSDITTFISAFKNITHHSYPGIMGHISIRLVSCPSICSEALAVLSNLSPYSFQASPSAIDGISNTYDSIPIGALSLFAISSPEYQEHVSTVISSCNQIYREFLSSEEGKDFGGQVIIVGDSVGAIMAYDALCRTSQIGSHFGSETSIADADQTQATVSQHYSSHSALFPISNVKKDDDEICGRSYIHPMESGNGTHDPSRHSLRLSSKLPRQCSSGSNDNQKFEFDVSDFFMFGSPLGTILAYRKMMSFDDKNLDYIQMYSHLFMDSTTCTSPAVNRGRRPSEASITSNVSGVNDTIPLASISSISQRWWGTKRLDYALYCPDGLTNFPLNALPYLFHASYWESTDVIAFILRQIIRVNNLGHPAESEKEIPRSQSSTVREKWLKKRTSVKLKNITANHRANDILVKEGNPQVLNARFMYGPLDMVALTGEKIDIHVMKDVRTGEWSLFSTEVTDKNGRISYIIPEDKMLTYGIFPVKMTVRGDRTSLEFLLAVVPQKTECVVFSIDGSFTASVSVTGKDPKVRAGAVDVVRHWQELGYVLVYITGRPDMQQQRVISWLAQHNFPRGLVSFADGLSTDPLRHKAEYLRNLQKNEDILIHAAYGSSKDIWVYSSLGLKPEQVFTIGKVSKKQHSIATVLTNGYAVHLNNLKAPGGSRPAQGNARMILPHGGFSKPGQSLSCLHQRRSAKRTTSYPLSGQNESWPKSPSIKNN